MMPDIAHDESLDAETLAQMDAEFAAGKYDSLQLPELPPLDPASDPFGMGFEWLEQSEIERFAEIEAVFQSKAPAEWRRIAGAAVRSHALKGFLAGGNEEKIIDEWAKDGFAALCFAAGKDGEAVLSIVGSTCPLPERVAAVFPFLQAQPFFAKLSPTDREALAISICLVHGRTPPAP
jgi:hypothetical protein